MSDRPEHTFLFKEGLWKAKGQYFNADGTVLPCEGESRIIHKPDIWINEGVMRIKTKPVTEFSNRYEVVPFGPGSDVTGWRSSNPDLADLEGQFIIVHDSITSPWRSASGEYWGAEFLYMISPILYQNRGFAFRGEEKLSAWAVVLAWKGE